MAFVQRDTSFQNFLKEFFSTPEKLSPDKFSKGFLEQIYAMYEDDRRKALTAVRVSSSISSGVDTGIVSTYVAGGEEALMDVRGVNTLFNLEDFAKNPVKTLRTLGERTYQDITKLDELASDRRSDVLEALTHGKLSTVKGRDAVEPQNLTTRAASKLGLPLVDNRNLITVVGGMATSAIRLQGSNVVPGMANSMEDRRVIETEGDTESQYKSYRDLSTNLTGLAGYMESPNPRRIYYSKAVRDYNRVVASELGINLDTVLPIKNKRTGGSVVSSKGTFYETLQDQINSGTFVDVNQALNDLLTDDTKLRKALGLGAATPGNDKLWANLDPQSKEFAREYLKSEFVHQEFYTERFKDAAGNEFASAFEVDMSQNPLLRDMAKVGPDGKPTANRKDLQEGIVGREQNRRTLEAELQARLREPHIVSRISNAAFLAEERKQIERIAAARGLAPNSIIDRFDPNITAVERVAIEAQATRARSLAQDRFLAATKSSKIANNLFFASTTKEILENIEKGTFLETALLTSKLIGTLPFTDPRWGTVSEYVTYLDRFQIIEKSQKINRAVSSNLGLAFEVDAASRPFIAKLAPKLFESETYVGWDSSAGGIKRWTQARIKPKDAKGLVGRWGLQGILADTWGESGKLFTDLGFPTPDQYNPETLLTSLTRTEGFLDDLLNAANDMSAPGAVPTTPFHRLAKALKYDKADNLNLLREGIGDIKSSGGGALDLLRKLSGSNHPGGFPLDPSKRWAFLTRIVKEKKVDQLLKPYAGLLNRYNRLANALHTFLYRELIWGGYAGNNFLIKGVSNMFAPFRPILQGMGFGDDFLLSEAVEKWGFVKYVTHAGNKLSALGANGAIASSAASKALVRFLGPTALKSLGYIASNFAGIVTGGVGYLLAAVGDVLFSFGLNIAKGNFAGAFKTAAYQLREKVRTISKLVAGVILGILSCITLPFIFVVAIVSMPAPFEPSTGGGAYADIISSKKLSVIKTATLTGNNIQYRITIKNITDQSRDPAIPAQDVTIIQFTDTLNYARACDEGGGIIDVTTDPSLGNISLPTISSLPKTTLAPGEAIEVGPFTLSNIKQGDGTYLNSVEIIAENDEDKKAEASASTKIGDGGCALCPSGWPTQPFILTQGPQTYDSHAGAEALDLASSMGQAIKATHNGQAYVATHSGGYGNHVKIVSPMGYSTVYAHLSGFNVSNLQEVNSGDVIGYLGNSGNSTGPHLHYEFENTSVQCIPGHNLRMRYVGDGNYPGSYIPENLPNPNCVGGTSCNMSR